MIQYKKIPPSKSVILLLLFLTTNVYGFFRENQNEYEVSRKIQNRYSMDLQQSQNMPIRRVGINRVINEKDGNAERLYDRRSFRTGTIEGIDNFQNRERSVGRLQRSGVDVRTDYNNNREFFTRNTHIQNTRDNRRSFESTIAKDNRQRQLEDRRFGDRAVISRNREYDERSLERSSDIRDRRNSKIEDLDRRINQRRIDTETRSSSIQRIRKETVNERREVRDRQLQARRITGLPQLNNREVAERPSDRLVEIRRSVRSVQDRKACNERNLNQRRSFTEHSERIDSRENSIGRRSVENRANKISDVRNVDQRRSSTQRLERMDSRQKPLERCSIENRDRRISYTRNVGQRRSSSEEPNVNQMRSTERLERMDSREKPFERRFVENRVRRVSEIRNVDQRRSFPEQRNIDQIRLSTGRLERMNSRENPLETRSVENRDSRTSEIRNVDRRRSSDEGKIDQMRSSIERLERMESWEKPFERRFVENRIRRVSEIRNVDPRRSFSKERNINQMRSSTSSLERMDSRENLLETRSVENRDSRISEIRNVDQRRSSSERLERVTSRGNPLQRRTITNRNRRVIHPTEHLEIQDNRRLTDRSAREDRTRDQPHRETRELSKRLTRSGQFSHERRDQRFSERQNHLSNTRKTTDRLQITNSEDRISLQRREEKTTERRASGAHNFSRENRFIDNRQLSRSDSTRYIQDNINSRDIRLTYRTNSARDIKENSRREITDRYNPLTADPRGDFEKIVSQRTTRDSVRNTETPALGLEKNINNNDAYTWVNTAKIILAAFLVGQIFVNSSKANRFRFHNILSVATCIKEKVQ